MRINANNYFFVRRVIIVMIFLYKSDTTMPRELSNIGKKVALYAIKTAFGYDVSAKNVLKNKYGKPYLTYSNAFFNISHEKGLVGCAVSENEVGFDITGTREFKSNCINRLFSDKEVTVAKNNTDFAALWAIKESYYKCLGTGLSINNLKVLDFSDILIGRRGIINGKLINYQTIEDYNIAICNNNSNDSIAVDEIKFVSDNDLLTVEVASDIW